jgi:hypothetical protein
VATIAAGASLILGILLVFSGHTHGELIRQWPQRFGPQQSSVNRSGGFRLLGLSTLGLLIVLTVVGGSRYAAMNTLATQPVENGLGSKTTVLVSPLRDFLISMLANLGVWVVGVFVAYLSNNADPDFVAMAPLRHRASTSRRKWRLGSPLGESKMQHTAKIGTPPSVTGESGADSLCESPPRLEGEGDPCRQPRRYRSNFRLTTNAN